MPYVRTVKTASGATAVQIVSPREKRQLKHRAEGDSRVVPVHPELTRLLRVHLAQFGTPPMAACSAVCEAVSYRPSPTGGPGSRRARWH